MSRFIYFILKVVLLVAISYSFIVFTTFYATHPATTQFAYGIYTLLIANILIFIGRGLIVSLYQKRHKDLVTRGNFILGINRVASVFNVTFIIIGLMIAIGINPKEFITSLTIVAMAITLIFKEYVTNMISGLIIMFSDQFSIGDRIKIHTYQGIIVDITLSNIVLRDDDDDVVLVPNNLVFTNALLNKTSLKSNKVLIKLDLPYANMLDVEQLHQLIEQTLKDRKDILPDKPIKTTIDNITSDHVGYKVEVYSHSVSGDAHQAIKNAILNAILKESKERTKE